MDIELLRFHLRRKHNPLYVQVDHKSLSSMGEMILVDMTALR